MTENDPAAEETILHSTARARLAQSSRPVGKTVTQSRVVPVEQIDHLQQTVEQQQPLLEMESIVARLSTSTYTDIFTTAAIFATSNKR